MNNNLEMKYKIEIEKIINSYTNERTIIDSEEQLFLIGDVDIRTEGYRLRPKEELRNYHFKINVVIVVTDGLLISNCVFNNVIFRIETDKYFTIGDSIFISHVDLLVREIKQIDIYRSVFFSVLMASISIEKLSIQENRFISFNIRDLEIGSLFIRDNKISMMNAQIIKIDKTVPFDIDQIDMRTLGEKIKLNDGIDYSMKTKGLIDTIYFLRENSDVKKNRLLLSKLDYLENKYTQSSKIGSYLIMLFGGFTKPVYFICYIFIAIILFAFVYTIPLLEFQINGFKQNGLSVIEAIYFSGITFSTIGYGDIILVNNFKLIVILEGVIGVLLTSSFLASILNKYTRH